MTDETHDALSPVRFAIAIAVALAALALARAVFAESAVPPVRGAIERTVSQRMGAVSGVVVEGLETAVADQDGLVATPEPGARTAEPARFVLWLNGRRVGYAQATVHVRGRQVRAQRELVRGEPIAAADVTEVDEEIAGAAFAKMPSAADVAGARPRRTIAAGERLSAALVALAPAVRTGDAVNATIRSGAVEVTARVVASGSGRVGDVIRVRSIGSRRLLSARITAPGVVEVIP